MIWVWVFAVIGIWCTAALLVCAAWLAAREIVRGLDRRAERRRAARIIAAIAALRRPCTGHPGGGMCGAADCTGRLPGDELDDWLLELLKQEGDG